MADIEALRISTFSTNLELVLQQKQPKFTPHAYTENVAGAKAHRFQSKLSKATAQEVTSSIEVVDLQANAYDGRWVHVPNPIKFQTAISRFDLEQTNITPNGQIVQNAVASINRQNDSNFLTAFFGTAKTGETGTASTSFTSGNQIAGNSEGLTITKLRSALEILLENEVDLDHEKPMIGISPNLHNQLLALTEVGSVDFNYKKPLVDGRVTEFMGFTFIVSNLLPNDGTYIRCPVWVKSGMACGVWEEINADIRELPNYTGKPSLIEVISRKAFTRLDEGKCVEIKALEV